MRSADWIKLDHKNLPNPARMLVCNGVQCWAVDMVHKGHDEGARGRIFAYTDCNREACELTHYAPIAMPFKDQKQGDT